MNDLGDELGSEQDAKIILRPHNHPVPGQFRTVRRVALVALFVSACHGSQASLPQLHVLNWAVRNVDSRRTFLSFLNGFIPPDKAVVRFDPTLPRVIQYAVEEGILIDRSAAQSLIDSTAEAHSQKYRISLTDKGQQLVEDVIEHGLLVDERLFLESIGSKITQAVVKSLFDWGADETSHSRAANPRKGREWSIGCDLVFGDGLVLLRADNTRGKSTCLMSILYALGLEGMLGPIHQPPLPPVLLSEIVTDAGAQYRSG